MYELLLEKKRRRGLNDLWFFDKYILGYKDMTSQERFHGEMCNFAENDKHKKVLILEPRGSLKSSCVTIGYTLQQITKDPDARVLIASEEFLTACKFLDEIKGHIEHNETFIKCYGELKGFGKWSEKEIIIRSRRKWRKEPTITAAGIGVTKVGLHYDLIVVDDPHSLKNISSREQIDKVLDWYKLLLSLLEPWGKLIIIATRWHYDDLSGWLIDQERMREESGRKKRFHILKKRASVHKISDKTPDSELLWPERLTREFLLDTRADQGPYHFSCQYYNEPVDDESAMFKRSWVQFHNEEDLPPGLPTFAVLDPVRDEEAGDWASLVTFSMTRDWVFRIREVRRGKWDEHEAIEQMFRSYKKWHHQKIAIESVAFQKSYIRYLKGEMLRQGRKLPIIEVKSDSNAAKKLRIRGMIPYWKSGLFSVPGKSVTTLKGNVAILIDELLRYPRVSNDDCIDALAYGDQIAYRPAISKILRRRDPKSFLAARERATNKANTRHLGVNAVRVRRSA